MPPCSRRWAFCVFLSVFLFNATVRSWGEERLPSCSWQALDVHLVFPIGTAQESNARWLAVEIQNRDYMPCHLDGAAVKFSAEQGGVSEYYSDPDQSEAALALKQKSWRLASGDVAHLLLAWRSSPYEIKGMLQDCTRHDSMQLYQGTEKKPWLDVRHLWMQSCSPIWSSSYRAGAYVPGEPITQSWLDRYRLTPADFITEISPLPMEMAGAAHPLVTLRSLSNVEYLKGSFESGYSGYFELYLISSSPASNCPFLSLRKREADGETVLYVNHCDDHARQPGSEQNTKPVKVTVPQLGMLPERPGRVEYDVVTEVLKDGKPALAHASAAISIRDPKEPMLPAIDTDIPGCQMSQLKLSPPVELGAHWSKPREYAAKGETWQDGKVFEVTNISSTNCMLGGTPQLKFLNAPEIKTGSLRPPVCRNCATSLFKPRDSRWIELKPNDSAHFIAVRTVFDPDYWFLCTVMGGLELTLPGDKTPLQLPFEAGTCGPFSASAWRAGRYDADPMNVQYDREAKAREEKRIDAAGPLPQECAKDVSKDTGRPIMLPRRGDLQWGISSRPAIYGEKVPVLLWLYNPTDKPQPVWTCMQIDYFWLLGLDVFDSAGQRVLDIQEEKDKERERARKADLNLLDWPPANNTNLTVQFLSQTSDCPFGCDRNFPIDIPPHTCVHGTFSNQAYDFARDLRNYYSLSPGKYFLVPGERGQHCKHVRKTLPDPKTGLEITIEEP